MNAKGQTPEQRVAAMGFTIPDYSEPPYGGRYGSLKAFHRTGNLLMLSGMTPEDREGNRVHPGRLGDDLTVEEGYEAARATAINSLGMIRLALGSLDEVASLARVLSFIVAAPDFEDLHLVSAGASDVYIETFGREMGLGGSAAIGVSCLSRRNCFEAWITIEAKGASGP